MSQPPSLSAAPSFSADSPIALIVNHRSGTNARDREALTRVVEGLGEARVRRYEFSSGDDIGETVRRAVQDGAEAVLAAGGDGSAMAVAGSVLGTGRAFSHIPLGTFNYFARGIGLPEDPFLKLEERLARYKLPAVITEFSRRYPEVSIQLHQGAPAQLAQMVQNGDVEMAIATESMHLFDELATVPCYRWGRSVVVPHGHPLAAREAVAFGEVLDWDIVGLHGGSSISLGRKQSSFTVKPPST